MSTPLAPRLLKGGLVLLDPDSSAVVGIITLQYNADSMTRTLQPQAVNSAGGDHSEALRLKGPPVETIKLEAELDATDQLEHPDSSPDAVQLGLLPQLSALETLVYPKASQLLSNNALASSGTLEITPTEAPLTLLVWGPKRVIPVRITDLSVTEEAFDANLNPIRAKVSLGMRVLSVDDLGFDQKGSGLYMLYQQGKEAMAARAPAGTFSALGIGGVP
jgi:hypothetical protein